MMPEQFGFAWTNLQQCLHTVEGCFKGARTDDRTQMGEFHALITLDSGEIRRAIIPQAIALPKDIANSYLLATTPFLIAGHRYSHHFERPKICLKGGGIQTMNVIRGHQIIRMTPISANLENPHRETLLHLRENYDPPSYIHQQLHKHTERKQTKCSHTHCIHLSTAVWLR
jgi:hypothetical protein